MVESEQLREQGWFVDLPHPHLGMTVKFPAALQVHRLARWPAPQRPMLGEQHRVYCGELGLTRDRSKLCGREARSDGQCGRLPLEGIRVADFSWYGPGRLALEAGLVRSGGHPHRVRVATDGLRSPGIARPGATGLNASGYFNNFNSNQLSLTLNMSRPEARGLALRLIAKCDVVLENYQPSVFEKWGLSYEEMKQVRPDIIFVRMPMVGTVGPHRAFQGFGASVTTLAGISALSGYPDRTPIGVGTNYPDYVVNPGHGSIAVLAALLHRKRTGEGQLIEVAQVPSTASVVGPALLDYSVNGRVTGRAANRQPDAAPHGAFPACPGPGAGAARRKPKSPVSGRPHDAGRRALVRYHRLHRGPVGGVEGRDGTPPGRAGVLPRSRCAQGQRGRAGARLSAWTAGRQAEALVEKLQARASRLASSRRPKTCSNMMTTCASAATTSTWTIP
jgi:crotonobetainyl-CoA:carnitine CoA-transferase CaiB-like acyl-CoA transferase